MGLHAKNPVVNKLNPFPLIDVKHNGVDNEQDTKNTFKTFFLNLNSTSYKSILT